MVAQDVYNNIVVWAQKADDVIKKNDIPDFSILSEVVSEFLQLSFRIISQKDVPQNAADFLLSDNNNTEIELPKEYSPLKKISEFRSFVRSVCENKIKTALAEQNFDKAVDYLIAALKSDIKNIVLFNYVSDFYLKNKLYKELIDLYKLMFIYSLDSVYFEKMGDIYLLQNDYDSALDAYLNCAESSDETVRIYQKLADVFGKINDNDSRLACLEHIKIIEAEMENENRK